MKYPESIMNTENGTCYLCGRHVPDTALHHIFKGRNRKISTENGFYVFLCPSCHHSLHNNPENGADTYLMQVCEAVFEDRHSREEFYNLIGRFYL